jgi:hypothetical protein
MDYSGQCSDGYFRLAAAGRLRCVVGKVERLARDDVVLASGEALRADVLVVAAGCRFNLDPPFLKDLGIGESWIAAARWKFHPILNCSRPPPHPPPAHPPTTYHTGFRDLHNYAFLGPDPRVGCASDFVFAYVPFGPLKQLEMFFHAVGEVRAGRGAAAAAALVPTALPNHGDGVGDGAARGAGHFTFFEFSRWWSPFSRAQEARVAAMFRTLDVGRPWHARAAMRVAALAGNFAGWVGTCALAARELWRFPVYGPGVVDHHPPRRAAAAAAARADAPAGAPAAPAAGKAKAKKSA